MPLNIADAESAALEATAKVKEWGDEFMAAWFSPLRETMIAMLWETLTPEQHSVLQARVPEAYQQLKDQIEKKKQGG